MIERLHPGLIRLLAAVAMSIRGLGLSRRIFEAEGAGLLVIGKHLAKARQRDSRPQGQFRLLFRHVVLELVLEPQHRRAMARALVENTFDLRHKWHMRHDML